nr:hypothetical protein [Halomonas sp.]
MKVGKSTAKVWIIIIVTYVMAIGEFTHIIVGTSEALYLEFDGHISWYDKALKRKML